MVGHYELSDVHFELKSAKTDENESFCAPKKAVVLNVGGKYTIFYLLGLEKLFNYGNQKLLKNLKL